MQQRANDASPYINNFGNYFFWQTLLHSQNFDSTKQCSTLLKQLKSVKKNLNVGQWRGVEEIKKSSRKEREINLNLLVLKGG